MAPWYYRQMAAKIPMSLGFLRRRTWPGQNYHQIHHQLAFKKQTICKGCHEESEMTTHRMEKRAHHHLCGGPRRPGAGTRMDLSTRLAAPGPGGERSAGGSHCSGSFFLQDIPSSLWPQKTGFGVFKEKQLNLCS